MTLFEKALAAMDHDKIFYFPTFAGSVYDSRIQFTCQYAHLVCRLGTMPQNSYWAGPWDMKFRLESQTDVEHSAAQPRKRQQDEAFFTCSDNSALYAAGKVDGRDRVGLLISILLDCR